jgi:tellurite methyltransferase
MLSEEYSLGKNSSLMAKILELKSQGKVLDMGCGEGDNAVFLAKKGFDVLAIDNRPEAIHKLMGLAFRNNVFVNGVVKDIRNFRSDGKFDVILCLGVLHFLKKEESKEIIEYIKKISAVGCLNIIETHVPKDIGIEEKDILNCQEIKQLYEGWEIEDYCEEYVSDIEKRVCRVLALKI